MRISDKLKRAIAFYISVTLFFVLLPIVLSYSLGYHIDYKNIRIYKTGIIYLKSRPSGALVYVNGRLFSDITPTRIEELKPGSYTIEVKREGFYPWRKDLSVRPNMVTKADEIVLFPISIGAKKIVDTRAVDFTVSDKNYIYYMTDSGLFRSGLDGANPRKISSHSNWPEDIKGKKFSPGGDKLLYFNVRNIWLAYLNPEARPGLTGELGMVYEVLNSPDPIRDVFWYSDSSHIVYVTDSDINVAEISRSEGTKNTVTVYKFERPPRYLYYDEWSDSLYFADLAAEDADKTSPHIYRLNLRQKFFDQLMQRLKKEFNIKYDEKR